MYDVPERPISCNIFPINRPLQLITHFKISINVIIFLFINFLQILRVWLLISACYRPTFTVTFFWAGITQTRHKTTYAETPQDPRRRKHHNTTYKRTRRATRGHKTCYAWTQDVSFLAQSEYYSASHSKTPTHAIRSSSTRPLFTMSCVSWFCLGSALGKAERVSTMSCVSWFCLGKG